MNILDPSSREAWIRTFCLSDFLSFCIFYFSSFWLFVLLTSRIFFNFSIFVFSLTQRFDQSFVYSDSSHSGLNQIKLDRTKHWSHKWLKAALITICCFQSHLTNEIPQKLKVYGTGLDWTRKQLNESELSYFHPHRDLTGSLNILIYHILVWTKSNWIATND